MDPLPTITLAWRCRDLPAQLRGLPEETRKVAKAQYNAHLLAGLPGDPVETTLAYLRKRRFAT